MWYTLDAFESWIEQDTGTVYQFVQERKNKMCLRINGHVLIRDYLKRGVTYETLQTILECVASVLDALDSELVKKDRVVMFIEQFLWNEHTQTVQFVPFHVVGCRRFLTQQDIIRDLIKETIFFVLTPEQRQQLMTWLNVDAEAISVRGLWLEHVRKDYSFKVTYDKQVIGRQQLFGEKTISQEHITVYMDKYNCGILIDNQSTNGTFLNGKKLEPLQVYAVKHGDRIMIAEEEFRCVDKQTDTARYEESKFVAW